MNTAYKLQKLIIILIVLWCFSTKSIGQIKSVQKDNIKEQIRNTEKQFEADLNKFGAAHAFEIFAAPDAVIKRANDTLIFGPKAIKTYYSSDNYKSAKANWAPNFIAVSSDGTLAYTYGKYEWIFIDKNGGSQKYHGIFHTVWKKQTNGEWKYVWD